MAASASPAASALPHRPEIEGLRAISVVAVVLYHIGVPGFSGGFVGVDVFFVISGFLITALLTGELESSGRVSFAGFYGRRARRLLPVAACVTVATVAVGWWVYSPLRHHDLAADALSTSTYTINLRLAAQQLDYLRAGLEPSAFQQFWSLAVEEQFYLIWPVVLMLAWRGPRGRRPTAVAIAAVCIASFAASVVVTRESPPWAFFSLPTRAWELGIGGLLALGWSRIDARVTPRARHVGQVVGLALIALSFALVSDSTPWPGSWALVPTIGTALVLAGPLASATSHALSAPPLRWIGVRSYSWYLWHWPAMAFMAAAAGDEVGGWLGALAALAALCVADFTFRRLEQPVRTARRLVASPRRSVLLGIGITLTLAATFALLAVVADEVTGPGSAAEEAGVDDLRPEGLDRAATVEVVPRNLTPTLTDAETDAPISESDGCNGNVAAFAAAEDPDGLCRYGDTGAERTVVLVGDSHAGQWLPALDQLGAEHHFRVVVFTMNACPAADITVFNFFINRPYTDCDDWLDQAVAWAARERPDLTVVSSTSGYQADGMSPQGTDEVFAPAMGRILSSLDQAGPTVLLGDTPPVQNIPGCLAANLTTASACAPHRGALPQSFDRIQAQAARIAGVPYVRTTDLLCGPTRCPVIVGRMLVYRQFSHVTTAFVDRLAPGLADVLATGAPAEAGPLFRGRTG